MKTHENIMPHVRILKPEFGERNFSKKEETCL